MDLTNILVIQIGVMEKRLVNPKEVIWLRFIVLKKRNFSQVKLPYFNFKLNLFLAFGYILSYNFWTGLYSSNNERTWQWSDGSPVDYLPWASGSPMGHASTCGFMYANGLAQLMDADCSNLRYIVCKKAAP